MKRLIGDIFGDFLALLSKLSFAQFRFCAAWDFRDEGNVGFCSPAVHLVGSQYSSHSTSDWELNCLLVRFSFAVTKFYIFQPVPI